MRLRTCKSSESLGGVGAAAANLGLYSGNPWAGQIDTNRICTMEIFSLQDPEHFC